MSGTPKIINPGKAPILWSTIEEAFQNINQNFNDLYATIQSDGSTQVVNFAQLYSDVSPGITETYDLGNSGNRWKELWLGSAGLNIGNAVITSTGTSINLPAGSTIGGNVLDQEYFKSIQVSGQPTILAEAGGESSLTVSSGTGIGITTNASTDTLTISNSGVTSIAASGGISINSATGAVTLTNTGVTAISNGTGISVNSSTGSVTISNSGVTRVEAGTGILLDTNTGTVTITNGSPASTIRCFQYISVPTQLQVQADTNADTLNLVAGDNIVITTDPDTDTITVSFNNTVDIIGSVFSDNSILLVDAVDGVLRGDHIGDITGDVKSSFNPSITVLDTSGSSALYIGNVNGDLIGNTTGYHLGDLKGSVFADDSSILVDSVDRRFIGNITGDVTGNVTGNIVGDSAGTHTGPVFTSTIDTVDSSAITIVPAVVFNSDVTVENELIVGNIPGYIKLSTLKSVVAASSSFGDFQTRISQL
jgi:hypothetical protein